MSWTYNNSNYRSFQNNCLSSFYYRCYHHHHHLRRFEIFLDSSDWLVHQLVHNNVSLAVQLQIQTPKDANRKFKKQNKFKISKFYFQLLTQKKKKRIFKHHRYILILIFNRGVSMKLTPLGVNVEKFKPLNRVNHNTSWNHGWSKVTNVHKTARILTVSRQSHFPTETVSWNSH